MSTKDKKNCWEFKKCNKEHICPAYPNDGRICWSKSGTFCGGTVQLGFAVKQKECEKCDFYQTLDTKY